MNIKSTIEIREDFENWFKKEEPALIKLFGVQMSKNMELFAGNAYYQGVLDTIKS